MLTTTLSEITVGIAKFIRTQLIKNGSFESRTFYGESFALSLLYTHNMLDVKSESALRRICERKDKNDSQYHWEFNNYALINFALKSENAGLFQSLLPLRFKHTSCTNWSLLRNNVQLTVNPNDEGAVKEALVRIKRFQKKTGQILDDPGVKSFQYHCFSAAMIGEIYKKTGIVDFRISFLKAVGFIRNFILSNGDTLYIGRGQQQSFGYASLIYILALAYDLNRDDTLLGDIQLVLSFLMQYRRSDGSFPLTMQAHEKNVPEQVDLADPQYVGWYAYNNYFDYLPFMGFFLDKAKEVLSRYPVLNCRRRQQEAYRDSDYIKVVQNHYEAVIARLGGYWTNDMPIPYVVTKGHSINPCYGGEQFEKSLYFERDIPIPYSDFLRRSIRFRSISFFVNDCLYLFSPLGIMRRKYSFDSDEISINTKTASIFRLSHIYLVVEKYQSFWRGLENADDVRAAYSASGRLKLFSGKISDVKIRFSN